MASKRGIDRLRAADYRAALLRAAGPRDVEEIVRTVVDIAREHSDVSERLTAASMLVQWTAGRAHVAQPPVDPLELPEVRDVRSALDAIAVVQRALGCGDIDGYSARVYLELVSSAAKLATADAAVDALAAAGRAEYAWTDEVPLEEQLPGFLRWMREQGVPGAFGPLADAEAGAEAPQGDDR